MEYINVPINTWWLIGGLFMLSLTINAIMLLRYLFNKYPDLFFEDYYD